MIDNRLNEKYEALRKTVLRSWRVNRIRTARGAVGHQRAHLVGPVKR